MNMTNAHTWYKHVTIACEDIEYNIVGSDKKHPFDRNTTEIKFKDNNSNEIIEKRKNLKI